MANTIATDQTHRISPRTAHVGVVRMSVVSTETYATASGGFTLDLTTELARHKISPKDVIAIIGDGATLTGHTPSLTQTATAGVYTVRLWNGATEIANGALTQTARLLVLYSQGSPD